MEKDKRLAYQPARQHQRFKAIDRALALVRHCPECLPYHIMDISEGGLSYRYLGPKIKRSEIKKINLYHDLELIAKSLPVKPVSDYRLHDHLIPLRRSSVQFKDLTDEQRGQLQNFIRKYTEAPLPT